MIGTDWLRRKAAARKLATGGVIRGEYGPELISLSTGYVIPTSVVKAVLIEPMLIGVI